MRGAHSIDLREVEGKVLVSASYHFGRRPNNRLSFSNHTVGASIPVSVRAAIPNEIRCYIRGTVGLSILIGFWKACDVPRNNYATTSVDYEIRSHISIDS